MPCGAVDKVAIKQVRCAEWGPDRYARYFGCQDRPLEQVQVLRRGIAEFRAMLASRDALQYNPDQNGRRLKVV